VDIEEVMRVLMISQERLRDKLWTLRGQKKKWSMDITKE
jgi:hypothetical protein